MTLTRVVILAIVLAASRVHAGSVTVVTTGDANLQGSLAPAVESWLRGHGHTIGAPLSSESVSTLLNCMVMDDQGCARGVVEAQAKGDAVLFVQAMKSRSNNATVLIVYWFIKGKEPIGMRRACEECTSDLLRSTLEDILGMVIGASAVERGRLSVSSDPSGLTVLLDNESIGVTPLEREVVAGTHTVVLMHRGQRVGEKTLKIHADVTAEIKIPVVLPADDEPRGGSGRSPLVGGLVMGLGGAALAAGIVLYVTSEEDTGEKLYYRDTKTLGIGVAAGGAVVAGLGVFLWLRARGSDETASAPVVSLTSQGGMVGWSGAF
jgi:hypothetical protein